MNSKNNKLFHSKLSELGLDKKETVLAISADQCQSSTQLSDAMVEDWLAAINNQKNDDNDLQKKRDRLRKKLIGKAAEAGWINPVGVLVWAEKYGYYDRKAGKNITKPNVNQYDSTELKKIINRFERQILEKTILSSKVKVKS